MQVGITFQITLPFLLWKLKFFNVIIGRVIGNREESGRNQRNIEEGRKVDERVVKNEKKCSFRERIRRKN